ncbi:UDP-GlcNAc:polypeptide N-acetylglucosaminyltransferase [Trypanosoma rangeli]|uniref:UDP-GlcNAc:polypeptide N-acetylglucosaminyltransferase n=1 Tax=Trypanosoma rangeli TaxID=5698 RepID=A0A422NS11_TRYRA|nr:UDP-GlcNAc:polypeptide N-acetylglucosaminyltransferase [Trypanosoma rangeli]RNF08282.1 UDP-GlcNAc:polypeptide N-acetylglucosaminyltransferase [Trypanosoma rangeli]|eukprot:RNF08282.1 UDP-GlcNAc:polypeptide N-acetylglucosaminyltransferase [Trypanosoma rangeli]
MDRKIFERPWKFRRGRREARRQLRLCIFCLAFFILLVLGAVGYHVTLEPEAFNVPPGSVAVFSSENLPAARIPVDIATIFVSIAAFRDKECITTLESLFKRAKYPLRVFLGISEERFETDVSCINSPEVLNSIGVRRSRTMRWKDLIPFAYDEGSLQKHPNRTPVLHERRDEDIITCLLSADASDAPTSSGESMLSGCQVITRLGHPDDARGPTYGRYITSLFYNNQDYYMVIDSHSRFVPSWDVKMIERARLMPTRGVLSHYPNGYTPEAPDAEINKSDVMCMCKGVILPDNIPKLGARWIAIRGHPVLQGFVAAGYIFGDAQYVRDVPFDPYLPFLFDGEEILYTVRLWTHGWDSYSPATALVYHNYMRVHAPRFFSVITRPGAKEHRELEHQTSIQRVLYFLKRRVLNTTQLIVTDDEAHRRNPAIVREEARFGMGKLRSLADYWEFVELSDAFLKEKDDEGRWKGGEGLCEKAYIS